MDPGELSQSKMDHTESSCVTKTILRILLLYRVDFIQERVVIQRARYYFENSI